MAYTIVGMFPTNQDADQASNELDNAGFDKKDYIVSRYSTSGEVTTGTGFNYEEDEKTSGFWNWLFGEDEEEKKRHSYAGSRSNVVTVYTDDLNRAEKARDIMNKEGAINVNEFTKDRFAKAQNSASTEISPSEHARIIAKAKNNLYLTDESRTYKFTGEGMSSDMDSQGNRDPF